MGASCGIQPLFVGSYIWTCNCSKTWKDKPLRGAIIVEDYMRRNVQGVHTAVYLTRRKNPMHNYFEFRQFTTQLNASTSNTRKIIQVELN
jgi:hypothetical protein